MTEPKWISARIATAIHDEAIYEFGGLAGVRDQGLLESPRNLFAYKPRSSLFHLAAADSSLNEQQLAVWLRLNSHPA